MSNLTNYLEDAAINYFLRNNADTFSPIATLYLGIFTATPGEAGGGTEATGGSYARQAIAFTDPAGGGATENTAQIDFTASGASWGTITSIGVLDAATVGNMYLYGALGTSRTVNDGETLRFAAGDVDFTLD